MIKKIQFALISLLQSMYGLAAAAVSGVVTWTLRGRILISDGTGTLPSYSFADESNLGLYRVGTQTLGVAINNAPTSGFGGKDATLGAPCVWMVSNSTFGWLSTTGSSGNMDTQLWRDAADVIAQQRAANAQTFRIYATFTDASNYERLAFVAAAGNMTIAAQTAGSGTDDVSVTITPAGIGAVIIQGLRTVSSGATAITTTRVMTLADAGGVFTVAQSSAYDIDLPSPTTGPGCRYLFQLVSPGAFNVTITVTGAAATFEGTIVNDVTSVLPCTGSTLTFVSGVAALGDNIEIISTATGKYLVRAISSAAGGITIA